MKKSIFYHFNEISVKQIKEYILEGERESDFKLKINTNKTKRLVLFFGTIDKELIYV